ncbi:MAG: aldolase/citrate lyase family protein [Candidimonas sp.]
MEPEMDPINPALQRMARGEAALGMLVRLNRSPEIVRVAKASGHDFVFIDTQHGLFSVETVGALAQAALGSGIAAYVRVRNSEDDDISRFLDAGITGIIVPDVGTADQARQAVDRAKFAPVGRRSVSSGYPAFDFKPVPLGLLTRTMNEQTLLVCMIETLEGLENVDAIAAVDGVDVVHIGCNDMLVAMGKPGQFGDAEIMEAVHRVIDACRRHGKIAGLGGERDLGRQVELIGAGVRFITTQSDLAYLLSAATARVEGVRGGVGSVPGRAARPR